MLRHTHVHKFLLPGLKAHAIPRLLWLSACCAAYGQTGGAKLEFEVASLKPSPPPSGGMTRVGCTGGPGQPDAGMFRCQNMSLTNFITQAYNISYYQLTAPDWAQSQKFDLAAKVPVGATKEDLAMMLQNMLIDRFQLKTHRESREITKYELVVAKNGPKLKEAVEEPALRDGDSQASPGKPAPPRPPTMDADGYPKLHARPAWHDHDGRTRPPVLSKIYDESTGG